MAIVDFAAALKWGDTWHTWKQDPAEKVVFNRVDGEGEFYWKYKGSIIARRLEGQKIYVSFCDSNARTVKNRLNQLTHLMGYPSNITTFRTVKGETVYTNKQGVTKVINLNDIIRIS